MPNAYVNSEAFGEIANANTISVGITASTGNLLIVGVVGLVDGQTCTGVADGVNTYTPVSAAVSQANGHGRVFYAKNITGGSPLTLTATYVGNTTYRWISVHEVSGADLTDPLNVHSESASSAVNSGAAVTTVDGCYIFGVNYSGAGGADFTAGGGFNLRENTVGVAADAASEDQIQSSAGSIAATFAIGNSNGVCLMAAFKPAAGGPPPEGAPILTGQIWM